MQQRNDDPSPISGTQSNPLKQTNFSASEPEKPSNPTVLLSVVSITANKSGRLSPAQRWRFMLDRLLEHVIGWSVVSFFVVLVIYNVSIYMVITNNNKSVAIDDGGLVNWLPMAIIAVLALALWVVNILPAFGAQVKSVTGTLTKRVITPYREWPQCAITVDDELFYVSPKTYTLLEDEARYRVYFLDRNKRYGGGIILSAELLESAPVDLD